MRIRNQVQLQDLNTLKAPSICENFVEVFSEAELLEAVDFAATKGLDIKLLGGGSNIVCRQVTQGLVIKMGIKGRSVNQQDDTVLVHAGAGENWHQLVHFCVESGYFGMENLALIPGTVGAAPIQNIGAYGVEFKDVAASVRVLDLKENVFSVLNKSQCDFEYRDSLFKKEPGRYIVTGVTLKLTTEFKPILKYGFLKDISGENISAQELYELICKTRMEKLPDPDLVPNAGSFFKNPIVDESTKNRLSEKFSDLVAFPHDKGFKLAAGWLLDQAGFKGFRDASSNVGFYEKQALVLVNPNKVGFDEIQTTILEAQNKVKTMFGILLEQEPVVF